MTISDKPPGLSKLRAIKRKTVTLSPDDLVSTSLLGGQHLPLMIAPRTDALALPAWAAENRESLRAKLRAHGALLFRGFAVPSVDVFAATVKSVSADPLRYTERSSPRHTVSGHIYTSTDHPPEYPIFLHNEQSYNLSWCRVISFHCRTAAATGGQTPLADTRRILTRLEPAVVESFRRRGYMYMRNFGDGFGLSWQEAFQTDSKAEVEAYCRASRIEVEWKPGNRLRTRQVRDAVHRHPETGELVWFNHCTFFHVSTLPAPVRDTLRAGFADDELPNQTFYGDGGAIEPEVMTHLQDTYLAEKLAFDWQEGDVLIVDNMLCAHGREPFTGERRVLTAMSELADGYRDAANHGATP